MHCDVEGHDGITLIRPHASRLEAESAKQLRGAVVELVNKGRVNILCDLSNVEFIDSSGMGVLVAVNHLVTARGRLLFCNMNERLQGVFTMTRLDNLLKVHPGGTEKALRAMRGELH